MRPIGCVSPAGWLLGATSVQSPNYNVRPLGETIDMLVIHGMSVPANDWSIGPALALLTNTLHPEAHPSFRWLSQLRVSAHFVIERSGRIWQLVSCLHRAWHAGHSAWQTRTGCNDFSIGIELIGADDVNYTQAQYHQLRGLIAALRRAYPHIVPENIVGHSDIAPMRKTDPGHCFDWSKVRAMQD